jgi:hypothetical protein
VDKRWSHFKSRISPVFRPIVTNQICPTHLRIGGRSLLIVVVLVGNSRFCLLGQFLDECLVQVATMFELADMHLPLFRLEAKSA